jgi:hypothetical protein
MLELSIRRESEYKKLHIHKQNNVGLERKKNYLERSKYMVGLIM